MDELITWLRAQLDDDERVARAAIAGPWEADLGDVRINDAERRPIAYLAATSGKREIEERNAAHIARWDPARVLAEIEAKRRILDEYETVCAEVRDPKSAEHRANARARQFALEGVLRLLASAYAGEPGWREEWRP